MRVVERDRLAFRNVEITVKDCVRLCRSGDDAAVQETDETVFRVYVKVEPVARSVQTQTDTHEIIVRIACLGDLIAAVFTDANIEKIRSGRKRHAGRGVDGTSSGVIQQRLPFRAFDLRAVRVQRLDPNTLRVVKLAREVKRQVFQQRDRVRVGKCRIVIRDVLGDLIAVTAVGSLRHVEDFFIVMDHVDPLGHHRSDRTCRVRLVFVQRH